jgi:hypothetical protein
MRIKKATSLQKRIAGQLGIDVSEDSFSVAVARILDVVGPAISEKKPKYSVPTQKQAELAKQLGIGITGDTFRVGFAKIEDKLEELNLKANLKAIKDMQLTPGDKVLVHHTVNINGQQHEWDQECVVSSIRDDGRVYFKGGTARAAWAAKLKKVNLA